MNQPPSDTQLALKCWFLTGATASGKTKVSLQLARILDAEIISLASTAIYRGMDFGTAKPDPAEQSVVPHHLIDIVDPPESFSVSEYRDSALSKIREIQATGKQVLFVGGTALYLKALLRGLFEGPPADWGFREEIEKEIENSGAEFLHQRLAMIDPVSAHKLHENDHRRIIRALEVYKQTGKPISHWQMQFDEGRQSDQCRVFTIRHARPILHQRIEDRVESMFTSGLVDEVKGLLERWTDIGKTASQAVGYREVIEYLENKMSMEETVERVRVRTRKFARHQETWFRGMSECRMLDLESDFDPSELAQRIATVGSEVVFN